MRKEIKQHQKSLSNESKLDHDNQEVHKHHTMTGSDIM